MFESVVCCSKVVVHFIKKKKIFIYLLSIESESTDYCHTLSKIDVRYIFSVIIYFQPEILPRVAP